MIKAEGLTRHYGDVTAASEVSFEVGSGEIVGLLGHNGAGKTTVMKMLTGYLEPSAGRGLVDGIESRTNPWQCNRRSVICPKIDRYMRICRFSTTLSLLQVCGV